MKRKIMNNFLTIISSFYILTKTINYNNYYINKNYFSLYNKTKNHIIKNGKIINDNNKEENESEVCKEVKKKGFGNKNTLNYQLVSGVSKEKLLRLSRNLSKTFIKTYLINIEYSIIYSNKIFWEL